MSYWSQILSPLRSQQINTNYCLQNVLTCVAATTASVVHLRIERQAAWIWSRWPRRMDGDSTGVVPKSEVGWISSWVWFLSDRTSHKRRFWTNKVHDKRHSYQYSHKPKQKWIQSDTPSKKLQSEHWQNLVADSEDTVNGREESREEWADNSCRWQSSAENWGSWNESRVRSVGLNVFQRDSHKD